MDEENFYLKIAMPISNDFSDPASKSDHQKKLHSNQSEKLDLQNQNNTLSASSLEQKIQELVKNIADFSDVVGTSRKIHSYFDENSLDAESRSILFVAKQAIRAAGYVDFERKCISLIQFFENELSEVVQLYKHLTIESLIAFSNMNEQETIIFRDYMTLRKAHVDLAPHETSNNISYLPLFDAHKLIRFDNTGQLTYENDCLLILESKLDLVNYVRIARSRSDNIKCTLLLRAGVVLDDQQIEVAKAEFDNVYTWEMDISWFSSEAKYQKYFYNYSKKTLEKLITKKIYPTELNDIGTFVDLYIRQQVDNSISIYFTIVNLLQKLGSSKIDIVSCDYSLLRLIKEKNNAFPNSFDIDLFYFGARMGETGKYQYNNSRQYQQYMKRYAQELKINQHADNQVLKIDFCKKISASNIVHDHYPRKRTPEKVAIFLHPGDIQYIIAAKLLVKKLGVKNTCVFVSRELGKSEKRNLGDLDYCVLSLSHNTSDGKILYENVYTGSYEDTLVMNMLNYNFYAMSRLSEKLRHTLKDNAISHAFFIPEQLPVFRQALSVCRELKIATGHIIASVIGVEPIYGAFKSQKHFVIDGFQKKIMNSYYEIKNKKIHIVGDIVAFDKGRELKHNIEPAVVRNKSTILICTQSDDLTKNCDFLRKCLEAITASGVNYEILIRPHPSENSFRIKAYKEITKSSGNNTATVTRKGDLYDVMSKSIFLLSRFSTVIMDSRITDCIPIALNFPGDFYSLEFAKYGYCEGASSVEELRKIISIDNLNVAIEKENTFRNNNLVDSSNPFDIIISTMKLEKLVAD